MPETAQFLFAIPLPRTGVEEIEEEQALFDRTLPAHEERKIWEYTLENKDRSTSRVGRNNY